MNKNTDTDKKMSYKDTLNLPRTDFSMKAGLAQKEPRFMERWEKARLYERILEKNVRSGKKFVLHDGPPYANGRIHMGHVLNKILKDICVKFRSMKGEFAPFVPGWDCHGLPVEHQLFKELNMRKQDIDQVKFRKKAHDYALKYVRIQAEEFKRLGIFADWDRPYLTLDRGYEADILEVFAELYEKGYIYKDLKPVNWCSTCETALAEAEVEYEEHVSPSVYVKFRIKDLNDPGLRAWAAGRDVVDASGVRTRTGGGVYLVIWTTTPWTLMANVAVAVNPDERYAWISVPDGDVWIVADRLKEKFFDRVGMNVEGCKIMYPEPDSSGKVLEGSEYEHPFLQDSLRRKVVTADYVSMEEGTGCVHTAPGHGQEDYVTGLKYALPILTPVDERGRFTAEAPGFEGRQVHEATPDMIRMLQGNNALISSSEVSHSYPHCWRCKNPIIFRATEQWFMRIDHDGLRDAMISAVDNDVEWIPPAGSERIGSMLRTRPDWCLSRQRYWGVPIPAFKCLSCGSAFTDAEKIRKVASMTRQQGADVWFEKGTNEFFAGDAVCPDCGSKEVEKEKDILDVWFDSGASHRAVLDAREDLGSPADLYLEGSDQHRGWFQASMITSMGIKGVPPYRKVLTHGFVVDGEGKKMSKSVGNVISPQDIMKKYGADILRLWVASSDYMDDIKISGEILQRLADGYRKIRNTFRFLLSNLYDFDPSKDSVDRDRMPEIDRWMLSRLSDLSRRVDLYYSSWEFHKVYRSVYNFCVYEVSSFYLDVLKDVLYIMTPDSFERRSAQTVLFHVLNVLVRMTAPILAFTSEEVWDSLSFSGKEESVHLSGWEDAGSWKDSALDEKWEGILALRDGVMKALEIKRSEGVIGSSLEASIKLYGSDDAAGEFLRDNVRSFPMLFKVSQASVTDDPEPGMEQIPDMEVRISVEKASGLKCQRCWNFSGSVGENREFPELCERCYNVISERRSSE